MQVLPAPQVLLAGQQFGPHSTCMPRHLQPVAVQI
jgi:hypothetical protein